MAFSYLLGLDWLIFLNIFKSIMLRNNDKVTFFSSRQFNFIKVLIFDPPETQTLSNDTLDNSTKSDKAIKNRHLFIKDESGDIQFISVADIRFIHQVLWIRKY